MTDNLAGFALKASVEEDFSGGSLAFRDGETFDLKQALDDNDGVIVVSEPTLIDALDRHEYLKRATVPDGAVPSDLPPDAPALAAAEAPEPASDAEPPEVSVRMDRPDLDAIAANELTNYNPDDYATKMDVVIAINNAREGD